MGDRKVYREKKDFELFEEQIIQLIAEHSPNLNWKKTKATRDGNKDALSQIRSARLKDGFDAWLEVKHRSNQSVCVSSRTFDSTLVSATESEKLKVLYLATNAKTNEQLYFRVKAFCARNLKKLNSLRILDNNDVERLFDGNFAKNINDFVFHDVFIVSPVAYSNHDLYDEKVIYADQYYHVVVALFNPFQEDEIITMSKSGIDVLSCALNPKWNFPSFVFRATEEDIKNKELKLTITFKGSKKDITKQLELIENQYSDIFHESGEKAADLIYDGYRNIMGRICRRTLVLILGSAGNGKTHTMEQSVAQWSTTHEIFARAFSTYEPDNITIISELCDFVFDTHLESQNYNQDPLDSLSFTGNLEDKPISRRRKAVFLDDWHKLSEEHRYQLEGFLGLLITKSENTSVIIFSRPDFKLALQEHRLFEKFTRYQLSGPSIKDIEASIEHALGFFPGAEEVILAKEISPNLVNLKSLIKLIKNSQADHSNLYELLTKANLDSLFQLPDLCEEDLATLGLIYCFPNGLPEEMRSIANVSEQSVFSLHENGLIKYVRAPKGAYRAVHDLWKEFILNRYKIISSHVLHALQQISEQYPYFQQTYLIASLRNKSTTDDSLLSLARHEINKHIFNTRFGLVKDLVEALVSSPTHAPHAVENISDTESAYMISYDFLCAGDILNHCGHSAQAIKMLNTALAISARFIHSSKLEDIYLKATAETINIAYWNFDLHFLDNIFPPRLTQKCSIEKVAAVSAILSRRMMALYLLDRYDEARKIRSYVSRISTKYYRESYKGNLLMDSAKNEMLKDPKKSISYYTKAIAIFKKENIEHRRELVAKAQREGLKIKFSTGSIEKLTDYTEQLKNDGFYQEYMNSMLDLATIYVYWGEHKKSNALLSSVSGHPDFGIKPRLKFKHYQCMAMIAYYSGHKSTYEDYWEEVLSVVCGIGDSYKRIPKHNLGVFEARKIEWYIDDIPLESDTIYLDPRQW